MTVYKWIILKKNHKTTLNWFKEVKKEPEKESMKIKEVETRSD